MKCGPSPYNCKCTVDSLTDLFQLYQCIRVYRDSEIMHSSVKSPQTTVVFETVEREVSNAAVLLSKQLLKIRKMEEKESLVLRLLLARISKSLWGKNIYFGCCFCWLKIVLSFQRNSSSKNDNLMI